MIAFFVTSKTTFLSGLSQADRRFRLFAESEEKILLASRQGESDLVYRKGRWYLFATVNVVEESPYNQDDYLGIDLGIARIAADSDGKSFSGSHTKNLRKRHLKLRQRLQAKKTKSAKRRLRERRRKESLFAKDINHKSANRS